MLNLFRHFRMIRYKSRWQTLGLHAAHNFDRSRLLAAFWSTLKVKDFDPLDAHHRAGTHLWAFYDTVKETLMELRVLDAAILEGDHAIEKYKMDLVKRDPVQTSVTLDFFLGDVKAKGASLKDLLNEVTESIGLHAKLIQGDDVSFYERIGSSHITTLISFTEALLFPEVLR